jgi:predicted GTPase
VIIMGAAGRDFHNFNTYYRDDDRVEVVAFTATQIPKIGGRVYPAVLAGRRYPKGIPIFPEEQLCDLIRKHNVDLVVFSYSDIRHEDVMHKASLVLAAGANFALLGPKHTTYKSSKPVISVCAVRTGVGKSQTTRYVIDVLQKLGKKVVAIRHPMPYGDLAKQVWQRFATFEDLERHQCTVEEREEYEPHIAKGVVVYAGVDYGEILRRAEQEADVILWDGGNNDFPFYRSDLQIVLVDPHRAGHELLYHPGETNLRLADVIVVNKVKSARPEWVATVKANIKRFNPGAIVIEADSPVSVEHPERVRGKRVLVVEDGPTLTHGEMTYGAGTIAAQQFGAAEIVDPRPHVFGEMGETYRKYPHIGKLLPAMGYYPEQLHDMESMINRIDCDLILIGTPIDLGRLIKINRPSLRVTYELADLGKPTLAEIIRKKFS